MSVSDRLENVWKNLDRDGVAVALALVFEDAFNKAKLSAKSLHDLRSVDDIPDKHLPMLGVLVGHEWDSDQTREWNRRLIGVALRRASYKGTWARLSDAMARLGITNWETVDQNSVVIVPGANGRWGYPDCYWSDDDFYHPGARHLIVYEAADEDDIRAELDAMCAAGEKWFISIIPGD